MIMIAPLEAQLSRNFAFQSAVEQDLLYRKTMVENFGRLQYIINHQE